MTTISINTSMDQSVLSIYPIWLSAYKAIGESIGEVYQRRDSTTTASVSSLMEPERELCPYELITSNDALAFWDNPEEDIYSFEDGEAI